jgi:hypothetical protein
VNPGSRSRFGPPQLNLAELKLLTDDQLMVQLQEGVNDALAVLFERYHRIRRYSPGRRSRRTYTPSRLASVPGTHEAQDAVLLAHVQPPQQESIRRRN